MGVLGARHVFGLHKRDRIWINAYTKGKRRVRPIRGNIRNIIEKDRDKFLSKSPMDTCLRIFEEFEKRMGEPAVFGMDDGWPVGWTDLKPLEMDKSHSAQAEAWGLLSE